MRLSLAVLTLAAGAAGAVVWLPSFLGHQELAVVTEVGDGGFARVAVPHPSAEGGAEAAGQRFFGGALTPPKPDNRLSPAPVAAPVTPEPRLAVRPEAPPTAVVAGPLPGNFPQPDRSRPEIVRDLQRELKRVGCYAGDVDGDWGNGSRRAMQAFLHSVNSTVPTTDPDLIQLTLVRGYRGLACAAQCPPDRLVPGTGRCLQGPVMAARPTGHNVTERVTADGTNSMQPTSQAVPTQAVPTQAWSGVARPMIAPPVLARPAALPLPPSTPLITATPPSFAAASPATRPLDGRMAIGGPPVPVEAISPPPSVSGGPAIRSAKPRPQQQQRPKRRVDRSWTKNFFDN